MPPLQIVGMDEKRSNDGMNIAADAAQFTQLDPDCVYLNHGSFGPSPQLVNDAREYWSRRLERQPMQFFCRDMESELDHAAEVLAGFLNTRPDRVVLLNNATMAMNVVAATVPLQHGDRVLLTDHEYGAVRNIWSARCRSTGAFSDSVVLPDRLTEADCCAAIEERITAQTKLLVISHVTSATACILPVKAVCAMARKHRIPVCIDGPHALSMLDVCPEDIGCDFYCASGHKWLCGAFGSGFLWAHPRWTSKLVSPIVSWGGSIAGRAPSWKDRFQWLGTSDPAALLALSSAIEFMNPERTARFRNHANQLIQVAIRGFAQISGCGPLLSQPADDLVSMVSLELPATPGWKPGYHGHPDAIQTLLRQRHGIEVLTGSWNQRRFLRLSAHLYNTEQQVLRCVEAVSQLLADERSDAVD